jgi:DNA-binding MarR family transcriptional regulator
MSAKVFGAIMLSRMTESPGATLLLTRLARAVYRRANEDVLGMKMKEFVALSYLRHASGVIGQRELSERLMLDANNTVLLLNALEMRDFAERKRHPDDRRRHIVEITPDGAEALERAEQAMNSLEADVLRGLSEEERATLRDLLLRALEDVSVEA